MSKRGYISRYLLILKKLKVKPYATYEELRLYMESQLEYMQMQDDALQIGFSQRTFQRDIKEISNLFGIDIEYSKSQKGYFICQAESENLNFQRMMEAFDMFNSLNLAQDLHPYIHLENRKPLGTENLYGLLHAIKNRHIITFNYLKFWEEEASFRTIEPLALKEFRNRWYVMGKEPKEKMVKNFALDRLTQLDITRDTFTYPEDFNIEAYYQYCFGVISPHEQEPEDIILSFTAFQGKYIKTLPLHHTQQILVDNEQEVRIKLCLKLTHDLLMELLSFADELKVMEPPSLVAQVKEAHQRAFGRY